MDLIQELYTVRAALQDLCETAEEPSCGLLNERIRNFKGKNVPTFKVDVRI